MLYWKLAAGIVSSAASRISTSTFAHDSLLTKLILEVQYKRTLGTLIAVTGAFSRLLYIQLITLSNNTLEVYNKYFPFWQVSKILFYFNSVFNNSLQDLQMALDKSIFFQMRP